MKTRILPALAMLAMLPTALQAQNAEERIAAAMQYAQNAGIPVSLLDSKVQEGKAKGIPMDRIAAAVERRAEACDASSSSTATSSSCSARASPIPDGAGREPLLLVGGSASGRGVVTSASYETRAFGVRSGMPTAHGAAALPEGAWWCPCRAGCAARRAARSATCWSASRRWSSRRRSTRRTST
jgi:hypothetical protein